ncbi:right-handed parallel beta-helix repeat-containing protein [Candidatus Woesearchaeota archaeon]|nr:right-handed parallel beta-helix repeat-containing protein [Candidatus Woesearchaeota archaeon]
MNRTNTLTGIKYKDDPTIFAWELANEPRARSDRAGNLIYRWIENSSAFIKSIDSSHMVATGEDGFYVNKIGRPEYGHEGYDGSDFINNSRIPSIDYASFHIYDWTGYGNSLYWVQEHAYDAHLTIKKPIVAGELGYSRYSENFEKFMKGWYGEIEKQKVNGDFLWMLCPTNFAESGGRCISYPGNNITLSIANHSNRMNQMANHAPEIMVVQNATVNESDDAFVQVMISDEDDDPVYVSINSTALSYENDGFRWETTFGDEGNHTFQVNASDGISQSSAAFTVSVGKKSVAGCIEPAGGMMLNESAVLCPNIYLFNNSGNGITIGRDNISLDCSKAILVGKGGYWGIYIDYFRRNVSVSNCEVRNFGEGIYFTGEGILLYKNKGSNNNNQFYCNGCRNSIILNNSAFCNRTTNQMGFSIGGSNNSVIKNTAKQCGRNWDYGGIRVSGSNQNVSDNFVSGNYEGFIANSLNSTFYRNIASNNSDNSLAISYASGNIFMNNSWTLGGSGAYFQQASGNYFYNNSLWNFWAAVRLIDNSHNNSFADNILLNNTYAISSLENNSNNSFYHNLFINNNYLFSGSFKNSSWSMDGEGNYWSSFDEESEGCFDDDYDKICDSPFVITGNETDSFPFSKKQGWLSETYFFPLTLKRGWNLASLPLAVRNATVSSVFSSLTGNFSGIFTYHKSGWAKLRLNDTLEHGTGFWIKANSPATVELEGLRFNTAEYNRTAESDNMAEYNLTQGWNLLGYPDLTSRFANVTFNSSFAKWLIRYNSSRWDAFSFQQENLSTFTVMKPGYGYWIKVSKNVTLAFH